MKNSEIEKEHQYYTEHRVLCKCGHSMLVTSKDGKELCTFCGQYVFATPKLEFKYRIKEKLRRKPMKEELEKLRYDYKCQCIENGKKQDTIKDLKQKIKELEEKMDDLKKENQSLKSLIKGGNK